MFELFIEIVVTVAVLALSGRGTQQPPHVTFDIPTAQETAELELLEQLLEACETAVNDTAVFTADERVTHQAAPDYAAMSIVELKALGKQFNIPGWKAWKKPATAIARLKAIAA